MLKRKLKKYKLLYQGILEISLDTSNGKKNYKLIENKKRSHITIIKTDKFRSHIENKQDGDYEFWMETQEKYCDLRDINDRNMMLSPMYMETKVYCESEENLYDMFRGKLNNIFFKKKNAVFHDIVRTREYANAAHKLSNEVRAYIDDMCEDYAKQYNDIL